MLGLYQAEEPRDSRPVTEQDSGTNFGKNDSGHDPGGSKISAFKF